MTARVVVIDDHPIVLRGVSDMIADASEFQVVATAINAQQGLDQVRASEPDIILLDLRLDAVLATELIPQFRELAPRARIVIFTAHENEEAIETCLQQGAMGILLKDASSLNLVRALRSVLDGRKVVDPRLDPNERRESLNDAYLAGGFQRLSDRELDVLRLLARGLSTREMAADLGLMPNTIRSYTQAILEKLQAKNRVMALAAARRLRLI